MSENIHKSCLTLGMAAIAITMSITIYGMAKLAIVVTDAAAKVANTLVLHIIICCVLLQAE